MSLKKKVVTHRYEGEYESPDGEIYDFVAIDTGDRCYVQWRLSKEGEQDPWITLDGSMLQGLYDCFLDLTNKKQNLSLNFPPGVRGATNLESNLRRPSITDHRASGIAIHSQVKDSMGNYDDSVVPIQSFSQKNIWDGKQGTAEMRTGINPMIAAEEAPETPPQWKLDAEASTWKDDAKRRNEMIRQSAGERVKRVSAGDII